jgi:nitroreductase
MTLQEAINIRTSRRKYLERELELAHVEKLQKLISEYNRIGGFRIELVLNNGEAFKGFTRSYGMLSGVSHYLGFIAHDNDRHAGEKIGYYGELLVLHATALGLGTCWIGGTFSKSKIPFKLTENERLACLITVGNTEETYSFKEKFIHNMTHRKTKRADDMFTSDEPVPNWFLRGMEAVQKAPSAMNKQPVMFSYQDGCVKASAKSVKKYLVAFDLGIAKLHFELGSGGGEWKWGNGSGFVRG